MRRDSGKLSLVVSALLALSCLCCHKVRSATQLFEPGIKYQTLAESALVAGTSSTIMIARTRSSGTVRISKAVSRAPEVVEVVENHGHFVEISAKAPGSALIVIDASSPEGADRRFTVSISVARATEMKLSHCGGMPSAASVTYVQGFPASIHYTYHDDLGPVYNSRASGVWPTPPSVQPAEAARPSPLVPDSREFLFDIPKGQSEPFQLTSPLAPEGKKPSTLEVTPVDSGEVDALRLGLANKQSVEQVQPLELSFLASEKPVCSLIPFTAKIETPETCELLLYDGTATREAEVLGAKMPWVRLVSAGICEISVSATLPALEQGGEPRVFSDRAEIKGYLPSDNLPR